MYLKFCICLKSEFSAIVIEIWRIKILPYWEKGRLKPLQNSKGGTSILGEFHIKSPLIWHKIFRCCFLCTIVQFTDRLSNHEIVALTRDFFLTPEITHFRQTNPIRLKCMTSEVHPTNRVFPCMTLATGVEDTNPGHQKHDYQRQLWSHCEVPLAALKMTKPSYHFVRDYDRLRGENLFLNWKLLEHTR